MLFLSPPPPFQFLIKGNNDFQGPRLHFHNPVNDNAECRMNWFLSWTLLYECLCLSLFMSSRFLLPSSSSRCISNCCFDLQTNILWVWWDLMLLSLCSVLFAAALHPFPWADLQLDIVRLFVSMKTCWHCGDETLSWNIVYYCLLLYKTKRLHRLWMCAFRFLWPGNRLLVSCSFSSVVHQEINVLVVVKLLLSRRLFLESSSCFVTETCCLSRAFESLILSSSTSLYRILKQRRKS